MSGYTLIEQTQLAPIKEDGLAPHTEVFGFLDLLRELAQDDIPFPRLAEVRLVGLEEALFAARPADRELAVEIHRRLQQAASFFERRQMSVQVIFQGTLRRGETLWSHYRGVDLHIDLIFDTPLPSRDAHGNLFYRVYFNLTSPAA